MAYFFYIRFSFLNPDMKPFFTVVAAVLLANTCFGQSADELTKSLMPVPLNYTVFKTDESITLDGKENEKAWAKTPWSEVFSDIEGAGGTRFPYATKFKMLWDSENLYVFMKMDETAIWAIHRTDDIVFRQNVMKLFFDPDNSMQGLVEIQVNPFNEVYYLTLSKPYRDKGTLLTGWMPIGAKSATGINGTINDPSDKDKDWTIEIALPLKGINAGNKAPVDGAVWRFDTQRTNYDLVFKNGAYEKGTDAAGKVVPQQNTAWSPPGMNDIPFPERWGYLIFNQAVAGSKPATPFVLSYSEIQRRYLWEAYYRQKEYTKKQGKFAGTLKDLNIPDEITIDGKVNRIVLEATSKQFLVTIGRAASINQEGLIGN
jgi:hypothetical protein